MKRNLRIMTVFLLVICIVFLLFGCQNNELNINVYTRDATSGTRDGFFTTIGLEEAKADNTKLVATYTEVESNGTMINAIKNDEYGIGYISLASLSGSGLKGLKYEGITPAENTVLNGSYKLTRNFNYVVRNTLVNEKERQIVEAFLAFLTTKDAMTTVKNNDGILEIPSSAPTWDSIRNNYPICNGNNSGTTIKFGGSTSVEKIAKALSAEFKTKCGNFIVEHNHTGSGDAYKRTQGSEKDGINALHIAFASREFNATESCASGTFGKICIDAIVVIVNEKNTVEAITAELLRSIFGVNGTIKKWSELE